MRLPLPDTLEVITFRLARPDDVDGLLDLFQHFFAESAFPGMGFTFDPKRARDYIARTLRNMTHVVAVDNVSGKIVGSLAYQIVHNYTDRPLAEMDKFYVLRSWRGSATGHVLLTLAMDAAKNDGAAVFRAGTSSGIKGGQNIFRRFGFTETPHSILFVKEL